MARGLGGVRLVTSDAHAGLIEAIAANLPGAVWQRCRTHYAANLMAVCPKSMWPAVKAMLHSVYDQPTATAVHEQFDRLLEYTDSRLPEVADHAPDSTVQEFPTSPTTSDLTNRRSTSSNANRAIECAISNAVSCDRQGRSSSTDPMKGRGA